MEKRSSSLDSLEYPWEKRPSAWRITYALPIQESGRRPKASAFILCMTGALLAADGALALGVMLWAGLSWPFKGVPPFAGLPPIAACGVFCIIGGAVVSYFHNEDLDGVQWVVLVVVQLGALVASVAAEILGSKSSNMDIRSRFENWFSKGELKYVEKHMKCCGINNYTDYKIILNKTIPESCCSNNNCTRYYKIGCESTIIKLYTRQSHVINSINIIIIVNIVICLFIVISNYLYHKCTEAKNKTEY